MASANRVQITQVRETTAGTTPTTPRMRTVRLTGESLSFTPEYVDSDEIRSDRMLGDPIKVMQASGGGISFELSFPRDKTPLGDWLRSALFNPWTNAPLIENDGTADSVITDAGTTADTFVVATPQGSTVVAGMLVRSTGFTNSANNQLFRAVAGSATTVVGPGTLGLVAETAPPGAAMLKVVGFVGNPATDISATSTGLLSAGGTNFTTMGLVVGQWIKIGATAAGNQFATAALNGWARVSAITATVLTLDNRPTGWTTDAGTGKLIWVFFGDQLKNGVTPTSMSIEKGFLDQAIPTYIVNTGMQVNTLSLTAVSRQKITGQVAFMGMGGATSTTALDASPDAATTGPVIAANANVARVGEAGVTLASPNCARQLDININNNLQVIDCLDSTAPGGLVDGEFTVTGRVSTYFGDKAMLDKIYAGTATSLVIIFTKNSQAVIITLPRVIFRSGAPAAAGKNQQVMLEADFTASIDTTTTNASITIDRLVYYE